MPAVSRETAVNKALSGQELKRIMLADYERLLDNEGLLSHHIAYGRVGYTLIYRLHMDNPMRAESEGRLDSHPLGKNTVEGAPEYAAIDYAPLASPSPDSVVAAGEVLRQVDSPNVERVRLGIPVPVNVRQQDGTVSQQSVTYPPQPELGDGDVTVTDTSDQVARDWGVKIAEVENGDPT